MHDRRREHQRRKRRRTCGSSSRTTWFACAAKPEMRLAYCTVNDWSSVDLMAMPGDEEERVGDEQREGKAARFEAACSTGKWSRLGEVGVGRGSAALVACVEQGRQTKRGREREASKQAKSAYFLCCCFA